MYALYLTTGQRITSAELQRALGDLDLSGAELLKRRMNILCDIESIESRGIRYSNHDFDVLSGALNFLDAVEPHHQLREGGAA